MGSWPQHSRSQSSSRSLKHLGDYQGLVSASTATPAAISTQSKAGSLLLLRDLTQLFQTHGFIILQPYLMCLSSSAGTKQAINTYSIDKKEAKARSKSNTGASNSSQVRFQQMLSSGLSPNYYKQNHVLWSQNTRDFDMKRLTTKLSYTYIALTSKPTHWLG